MKKITLLLLTALVCYTLSAQDFVTRTFKDTRVINAQSVEMLQKRMLDIRIGHRFGDLLGDNGGWQSFYGLENASDVMIGADFGLSDNFSLGFYRTKGAGDLTQLLNGIAKYRVLRQSEDGTPVSIVAHVVGTLSTMAKEENSTGLNSFPQFSHRMSYTLQFLVGRKFSDRFSLQVSPGYTHRNLVKSFDNNDVFSLGIAGRLQLSKVIGIIVDTTLPLNGVQSPFATRPDTAPDYFMPFGIGLEFDTGGHVFQVNLTNARGLIENDYITSTTSSWGSGAFRLGFTISRVFKL